MYMHALSNIFEMPVKPAGPAPKTAPCIPGPDRQASLLHDRLAWLSRRGCGLRHTPRRSIAPALQRFGCPCRRLVCVAQGACVGDLQRIGLRGSNELEGMGPHIDVRDGLLDFGHVARHALAARAPRRMVRMRLDGRCMRAILCVRSMTARADLRDGLDQHRVVLGPVWI